MTRNLRSILVAAGLCAALVPFAQADQCTRLTGKTQCFTFTYSSGGSNSFTAQFGSDGSSFTFPDVPGTTGTYTCAGGLGLVDVEYLYGGFEQQSWYGVAKQMGNAMTGNGKSITNGYMYKFTSVAGACASAAAPRNTDRQDR
jgi:hypothetical protein